ncbi:MAG TPA: hypothetical protein VM866_01415 [Pyrinomonadaceae bacterium]|jgi:hypothetical protein|nr:hypothetical protein [Pyrinomonadaceae bacterium]
MNADQDQARLLAERIARRLSPEANAPEQGNGKDSAAHNVDDMAALRAGLSEIRQRLEHIEAHITHDESCRTLENAIQPRRSEHLHKGKNIQEHTMRGNATVTRSPWLSGTYVPATAHPSDERFGIGEAVSELVDYFEKEKTCNLESGEKPCDHCGMCNSRGF